MKLSILYHLDDEFTSLIDEFVDEISQLTNCLIEKVSLETVEGSTMAQNYDIVQYPALLIIRDDGQLYKGWQGPALPGADEVADLLNK